MFKKTATALLFVLLAYFQSPASANNDENHFTIVEKNNLKGLFDEDGNTIIPISYEDLGWSGANPEVYHKVIGYREKGYWGLIDVKNQKVTSPVYHSLLPFHDKLILASRSKENSRKRVYGLINYKGKEELSFRYASLVPNHKQLIASVANGQNISFGIIDDKGQAVVGFSYNKIFPLSARAYAIYNQQHKLALASDRGKFLTEFIYDSVSTFNKNHLAIVFENGKQGVIHEDGTVLVPADYQRVKIGEDGQISVLPFNQWYAMSGEYKKLMTYTYEDMQPVGINLYQVKVGHISTFIDQDGHYLLSENTRVKRMENGFPIICKDGKLGVMSGAKTDNNQLILDIAYDSIRVDGNFILAARMIGEENASWSLFNNKGEKLSSYAYQDMKPSSEGLFPVKRKNYWGYINQKGEEAIPCQYLSVSPFSQGRASVHFIDGQGIIDGLGNWMIKPFKYKGASLRLERIHDDLYIFSTEARRYEPARYGLVNSFGREIFVGHCSLKNNGNSVWETNEQGKVGLISYSGQRLLDTKYDSISGLQEGTVYTFLKEGHIGIMSREGKILVNLDNNFQELHPMSEHYLGVKINDKFGFVDTLGRLRIANRYDSITHFKSDMAAIKLMGRWGYINRSEVLAVQPHFDKVYPFSKGLAVVKKDGKYGMVNKKGETVVQLEYDNIRPAKEDRFIVEKYENGQPKLKHTGLVNEKGMTLIYPKYDSLEDLGNGYVIISRNGRFGLLTTSGRSTIPLSYDDIRYDPYNNVYLVLKKQGWKTLEIASVK
ncbi:MAG: WG repeat-containing protein [Cyclobacteriaceae bacterium]